MNDTLIEEAPPKARDTRIVRAWHSEEHQGGERKLFNIVGKHDKQRVFGPAPWRDCLLWRRRNLG